MGKINEFEQKIIKNGMTDEDFIEYGKLLKRVHGNYQKRQHCYITAIQLPKKYAEQAIKLIQYGLENFEDSWFSTYTSYLYMGKIYENIGNYLKSYEHYLLAKDALGENHTSYVASLSLNLLWMKLHIDSFCYSVEVEEYLLCFENDNTTEFEKWFINSEFRIAVANIIILLHYGKTDEARELLEKIKKFLKPNYTGKLYKILARHKHYEEVKTTPEVIDFIKNLKI